MSKAAELAALIGSQTALSNRNLVINGAMQVAQRGTSSTTIGTSAQTFRADRFQIEQGGVTANNGTIEVATDAPTGFKYSTKITGGSSVTFNSNAFAAINYRIEGTDVEQFASGTSSPKSATLSFYVKSSVTGTYSLNITKYDGSTERFHVKTYTINSANTWEYKTVTFENESSFAASEWMRLYWQLGGDSGAYTATAGTFVNADGTKRGTSDQPNMISTSGATFLLTGVQLEVGEQATPFEHRSYADELARCQRYYEQTGAGNPAKANSSTEFWVAVRFAVTKRANPTASMVDGSTAIRIFEFGLGDRDSDSTPSISSAYYNPNGAILRVGTFSGISAGDTAITGGTPSDSSANQFAFDAEL
nr:hypothetical protein 28 [Alphaproteobacteria bacterium]